MKVILDTHTLILVGQHSSEAVPNRISVARRSREYEIDQRRSIWEVIIKQKLGELTLSAPLSTILMQQQARGFQMLPISLEHVLSLENLPRVHRDQFDRILVTQANAEGAVLLTLDPIFSQYPVQVMW